MIAQDVQAISRTPPPALPDRPANQSSLISRTLQAGCHARQITKHLTYPLTRTIVAWIEESSQKYATRQTCLRPAARISLRC